MTPAQCRAARGLLKWHQTDLAARARVAVSTIRTYEAERSVPKDVTVELLKRAFEDAGVEFLPGGCRVR